MSEQRLDKNYWNQRYAEDNTGWDIGFPSTPLETYIDGLEDKTLKILVPGAGNAHEAEYLWKQGFTNTHIIDIAPLACEAFAKRVPEFPSNQIIEGNFFTHEGSYDLILEQTFFCAQHPDMRKKYVSKMAELLVAKGLLVGVLFNFPLDSEGPPFGGSLPEYQSLFTSHFKAKNMEICFNSIPQRAGNEIFIELIKK